MTTNHSDRSSVSGCNPITCRVEAVLSIDNRGQIVLPKEVRNKANIRDGDKLVLVSWVKEDSICCLAMIRADNLSSEVSGVMRSLLGDNK